MRKIVAQKSTMGSIESEKFNHTFWSSIPAEKKLIIAWEMISEASLFRGEKDVSQPRLQRSVQHIKRREG